MDFAIDPRLLVDSVEIGDLPVCRLLLRDVEQVPWIIAVPRIANISELFALPENDQQQVWREVMCTAARLKAAFSADKINIASFGNIVPMLHVHILARRQDDAFWPGSAIGTGPLRAYSQPERAAALQRCRDQLL